MVHHELTLKAENHFRHFQRIERTPRHQKQKTIHVF